MAKKKDNSKVPKVPDSSESAAGKRKPPPLTRDVGVQSKGQRLQRLRAILLLVKKVNSYPETASFAAVEFQGDVYLGSAGSTTTIEYVEENKNYDPKVQFTMNSHEILNSLVAFCDCWISKGLSKHLYFGFYTPNKYGSEKSTKLNKSHGIVWPDKPMLQLFAASEFQAPQFLEAAKQAIIGEYERQAACRDPDEGSSYRSPLSNLAMIEGWDDTMWRGFFAQIEWCFGMDDANTIVHSVVDAIQSCSLYNEQLAGKEGHIISVLTDLIDKRQSLSDPTQRVLHVAEVILAFKNVETGTVNLPDPLWKMWEQLQKPTDSRNLVSKVTAVCPSVSAEQINAWSRKAAQSMIEQREHNDDKQVLSAKYRVYEACQDKLIQFKQSSHHTQLDEASLRMIVDSLQTEASKHFAECAKQYHYTLRGNPTVQAIVFELIDSCFLSFDGAH